MILRKPIAADQAEIARLLGDAALQHLLLAYPNPDRSSDIHHWLAKRIDNPDLIFFVIADDADDTCCGFVQLSNIHHKGRFAWLGMALTPQCRGQGLGRCALRILVAYAVKELKLRKILLEVRVDNRVAIQLYESEGFRRVGIMKNHYIEGRQSHDVMIMERLLIEPIS